MRILDRTNNLLLPRDFGASARNSAPFETSNLLLLASAGEPGLQFRRGSASIGQVTGALCAGGLNFDATGGVWKWRSALGDDSKTMMSLSTGILSLKAVDPGNKTTRLDFFKDPAAPSTRSGFVGFSVHENNNFFLANHLAGNLHISATGKAWTLEGTSGTLYPSTGVYQLGLLCGGVEPELGIGTVYAKTGDFQVVRGRGTAYPTTGAGVELQYANGGIVESIDRGTGFLQPLALRCYGFNIFSGANTAFSIDSSANLFTSRLFSFTQPTTSVSPPAINIATSSAATSNIGHRPSPSIYHFAKIWTGTQSESKWLNCFVDGVNEQDSLYGMVWGSPDHWCAMLSGKGGLSVGNRDHMPLGVINAAVGFRAGGGVAANGSYLRGNGTNFVASSLCSFDLVGAVPQALLGNGSVGTGGSLCGGGTLDANLDLHLAGDSAAPGASKYYGTSSASGKGYHNLAQVPIGGIVAFFESFSGASALDTSRWSYCDGANGTPNLNGSSESGRRFLRGTSGTTGGTGGSVCHSHSFVPASVCTSAGGTPVASQIDAAGNVPPYFEVKWIIRIA